MSKKTSAPAKTKIADETLNALAGHRVQAVAIEDGSAVLYINDKKVTVTKVE